MLEQVQEARRRVLADLAARRRTLSIQIEQLRAARDEMAASVGGVRDSVDTILRDLARTDDEARAAALAAGDQARIHGAGDEPTDGEPPLVVDGDPASGVGGDDGSGDGPAPSVDELFARIRAGSDTEGAAGPTLAGADAPEAPAAPTPEAAAPEAAATPSAEEAQDPLARQRNELLAPITAQLSRHVKRALGDDQNRLLDVLRSAPATAGDELLGPEEAHLAVFASAAHGHLVDAFGAGTVFAGKPEGSVPVGASVDQTAAGLARTVVTMLRRRMAEVQESEGDLGEGVGAAYREWRGERIERLVGDFAVQAFSAGTLAAALPGDKVTWVLTNPQGCSDCDDNALAGPVTASEGFPTGHSYPPAHSGCRCLVAPA